jgi:hypothetical protein
VDRFADKYHDKVYGYAAKNSPTWHRHNKKHPPPAPAPPAPPGSPPDQNTQPRARSQPGRDRDYDEDYEDGKRNMYVPERRRDEYDDRKVSVDERSYYSGPNGSALVVRDDVKDRYAVAVSA